MSRDLRGERGRGRGNPRGGRDGARGSPLDGSQARRWYVSEWQLAWDCKKAGGVWVLGGDETRRDGEANAHPHLSRVTVCGKKRVNGWMEPGAGELAEV